jgi:hypothetical protein
MPHFVTAPLNLLVLLGLQFQKISRVRKNAAGFGYVKRGVCGWQQDGIAAIRGIYVWREMWHAKDT